MQIVPNGLYGFKCLVIDFRFCTHGYIIKHPVSSPIQRHIHLQIFYRFQLHYIIMILRYVLYLKQGDINFRVHLLIFFCKTFLLNLAMRKFWLSSMIKNKRDIETSCFTRFYLYNNANLCKHIWKLDIHQIYEWTVNTCCHYTPTCLN